MTGISSISEFLLQAGTQYRVYDMGRGIRKLNTQTFLDIENASLPHPFPRQQHAWLGIVFWNKSLSSQQYIWFIKLPLDEVGFLVSASRNHFLEIVVEALGHEMNKAEDKGQLPENPYTFTPAQQQLADFNSIIRADLKLPPSDYYQKALSYLQQPETQDWRQVPLQGLTDVIARWQQKEHQQLLEQQLFNLPEEVLLHLLASMENQAISVKLTESIINWLQQQQDPRLQAYGLRALTQSPSQGLVTECLMTLLVDEALVAADLLVVIAGRHWQLLQQPTLLQLFIRQLAESNPQHGMFKGLYADLVQLPELRGKMLELLRQPDKSVALTAAIGELFSEANA